MNLVLERRVLALDQQRYIVRDHVAKRFAPSPFVFGKVAKDMTGHEFLHSRLADAYSHALVVGAKMRRNRPHAVMPGIAAANFHPNFSGPQINLIVEDGDVARLKL